MTRETELCLMKQTPNMEDSRDFNLKNLAINGRNIILSARIIFCAI